MNIERQKHDKMIETYKNENKQQEYLVRKKI